MKIVDIDLFSEKFYITKIFRDIYKAESGELIAYHREPSGTLFKDYNNLYNNSPSEVLIVNRYKLHQILELEFEEYVVEEENYE